MRTLKCTCGTCRTCRHREYMRTYYQRPDVAEKQRAAVRARHHANRESNLVKMRELAASESGRASRRRYRDRNREKIRAHSRAERAVKAGKITRQPCEVCGARAEMHHDDYSKALDVRWFCRLHHAAHHRS